ncbi:MAG TPA: molybdopterin cofactor-binding domain-containing protein [Coleofasciculaceae cyanobacterium]
MAVQFRVNGVEQTVDCAAGCSLLSLLRQQGWTGTRRVCETGDCGSCTVWVAGTPVHSCLYPAQRVQGCEVTTIEGVSGTDALSPMQQAFLDQQGFQCGFCTSGMIMTAEKLDLATLESEAALRQALDGNLCRCTGYQAIIESMQRGAALKGASPEALLETASSSQPQIGQSIPKQDGRDIVTGQPIYTGDWQPAGLLQLKVLRSPHPHARIRRIDLAKAAALPGVQAIFTHQDVPRRAYTTAGHGEPVPDPHDHYLLDDKVRFIGDRIAAVVADSTAIALQACQLIEVEYEILPHVVDPVVAMGERVAEMGAGAWGIGKEAGSVPLLHDEPDSYQIFDAQHNISGEVFLEKGDVEAGWAEADWVIERSYDLPAVQHFHLEPHLTTTWLEADGTLMVRSSTQVPFHCQRLLSQLFDLPKEKVRVFKTHIGGGFGNKQEILSEDLCALATLKLGRPVQWEFTRQEEFTATTSRHAIKIHLKAGVKRDGRLTAVEMNAIANTGAYGNHGTQVVFLTGTMPLGLYRCPNQRYRGRAVYTNTMPAGAFRGYGASQGFFAMECLLDEIAHQLQLDPVAIRRQQLITATDTMLIGSDHHFQLIGSYGLTAALDQVLQALNYQPGAPPIVEGHLRRGVGIAVAMQGSGLAKIHQAGARLALTPDGRYQLRVGSVDLGTGSETSLRQFAADPLTTTIAQIDIIAADTHETPFDAGAYASATTYITGQAVVLAAQALRSRLLAVAAALLNVPPEHLTLRPEAIVSSPEATDPNLTLTLTDLAQKAEQSGESLQVEKDYTADQSTLTFAVQGTEVEVDTETGRVRLLRAVQAVDLGKAINPRICEGQVVGGMVMGLGYALQEELRMNDRGQILNPQPRTYRLPLAKDVPPIQVILIEQADPHGPAGAKGVGEVVTNCTAPAVVNAIAHATGVHLRQLPVTPERLWQALQSEANLATGDGTGASPEQIESQEGIEIE